MVARGGTPRRPMLAVRRGDQRRNLFHESGGTKFHSWGRFGRDASCKCRRKEPDSGRRLAGTPLAGAHGPLKRGAAMRDRNERLTVEVRLLPDPCLWCWEIRDAQRNEVLESSWAGEWTAYGSPEEALRAGRRRLVARPAA